MRKMSVFILLICHLAFSTGVIVNAHYCMNRLASTQLFATASKECGKCGMHIDDSHGCCRDEVRVVKMDDDQKLTAAFSPDFTNLTLQPQLPSAFISTSFYNVSLEGYSSYQPPPLLMGPDTYLQNCVFRIWDSTCDRCHKGNASFVSTVLYTMSHRWTSPLCAVQTWSFTIK